LDFVFGVVAENFVGGGVIIDTCCPPSAKAVRSSLLMVTSRQPFDGFLHTNAGGVLPIYNCPIVLIFSHTAIDLGLNLLLEEAVNRSTLL
jgi:hypothetical protein